MATDDPLIREFFKNYNKELAERKIKADPKKRGKFNPVTATMYRYYNSEQELLYIGVSITPVYRQQSHTVGRSWWPDVTSATFQRGFASSKEMYDAEAQAIIDEKPKYNIATWSEGFNDAKD